jgi:glycosyltransferase involved in cell wall biosynthesis
VKVFVVSHSSVVDRFRRKWTELARRPGVELTVLVPSVWPEGGRPVRATVEDGAPYRLIRSRPVLGGVHALHFYPLLPYHLACHRPDLLHVEEEPWNVVTAQAALLGKALGARVVFFTWENLRRSYPFPLASLLRTVLRLSDGAIAGSETARDLLRHRGFAGRLHVLPQYGVDAPSASAASRAAERFVVGYAGRLVVHKGVDTLLDAVAGLPSSVHLLVVGDGPHRPALRERVQRLGLQGRVEMVGAVPHGAMAAQLARMDALVLPSLTSTRWKEQFGRVLIEAMALGVPVIGSDSGEIPWVIGQAGLVFPEGDGPALRQRLAALLDDAALGRDLAARGRARVAAHFTHDVLAARTYAIYADVLSAAQPAAAVRPEPSRR